MNPCRKPKCMLAIMDCYNCPYNQLENHTCKDCGKKNVSLIAGRCLKCNQDYMMKSKAERTLFERKKRREKSE